jgi:hypothetical protein
VIASSNERRGYRVRKRQGRIFVEAESRYSKGYSPLSPIISSLICISNALSLPAIALADYRLRRKGISGSVEPEEGARYSNDVG